MKILQDKVILVIGCTSVGLATTLAFAQQGAKVVVLARYKAEDP
jgi:NAD(P)-dependent dehydrogenase (short-subunit alcohol dehydrogenase family)